MVIFAQMLVGMDKSDKAVASWFMVEASRDVQSLANRWLLSDHTFGLIWEDKSDKHFLLALSVWDVWSVEKSKAWTFFPLFHNGHKRRPNWDSQSSGTCWVVDCAPHRGPYMVPVSPPSESAACVLRPACEFCTVTTVEGSNFALSEAACPKRRVVVLWWCFPFVFKTAVFCWWTKRKLVNVQMRIPSERVVKSP